MILEVKELSKHFGGLKAVDKVSFNIEEREITALIGPNGAGKTTLFNCIAGFYLPTSGQVIYDGEDITWLKPASRRCLRGMARTFQVVKPFPTLTVLDNVMVGGFTCPCTANDCRDKALEVLEFVGLAHRRDVMAGNITFAERRRMELARSLATNPKFLMLDEVMAGLTPKEVKEFLALLRDIRDNRNITILLIEHIMAAVMNIADQIMVLHHGQLISRGTPEEVTQDPAVIEAYLGEEFQVAES